MGQKKKKVCAAHDFTHIELIRQTFVVAVMVVVVVGAGVLELWSRSRSRGKIKTRLKG